MRTNLNKVEQELIETLDKQSEGDFLALPGKTPEELGELRGAVEDGTISVAALTEDGKRVGTAWYALADDETLWIVGVRAVSTEDVGFLRRMGKPLLSLATRLGCKRIIAETARSGVFTSLVGLGFKPTNVKLEISTDKLKKDIYEAEQL